MHTYGLIVKIAFQSFTCKCVRGQQPEKARIANIPLVCPSVCGSCVSGDVYMRETRYRSITSVLVHFMKDHMNMVVHEDMPESSRL